MLGNSDSRIVICEDAGQTAKVEQVRERLGQLAHVVVMEHDASNNEISIEQLRASGRGGDRSELDRRCEAVSPGDPYTIIYTSGTTGPPKGVVLSHGNCASVGVMCQEIGFVTEDDVSYLFLPLAHSFALTVQLATFDVGSGIVYWAATRSRSFPS